MKAKITPIFYIFAILLLAACSQENPTAQPLPTATAIALQKLNLANHELLTDPRVAIACDSGEGATIECARDGLHWQLAIDSNPSTFARFSLRFPEVETPLQGTETLLLRATFESQERPYLYLVQADGKRIATPIDFFKPRSDPTVLAFPLSEIHDENGNAPDFSTVNEVQLVFEYGEFHQKVTVESLQFAPVWSHSAAVSADSQALAEKLTLPEGFVAEAIADHMHQMTQIVFTDQGDMLVSLQEGQVWWYSGRNPDGSYQNRHLWAAGFEEVVGLLYDPNDGAVWIGGRGKLYYTRDSGVDGVADIREVRIEGLPWGRHQNNSLTWNPDPDPFTGEAGSTWLYFGLGSTDDLVVGGERNATVLRFPRTGSSANDLQIVSRGNRNAYTVLWADVPDDLSDPGSDPNSSKSWQLFASENGPDFNDAPDEVNHIRWQHDYGFPDQFGAVANEAEDGKPYSGPVYPVAAHASADGLAYVSNPQWPAEYRTLYVSLFGEIFSPTVVGHTVDRIKLREVETATGKTYRGESQPFVVGMERPLPMAVDPDGNLLVSDYSTGVIYRISYQSK